MTDNQHQLPQDFTLDLDKWVGLFPLAPLSTSKLLSIGSVGMLAIWEQIRTKHLVQAGLATLPG